MSNDNQRQAAPVAVQPAMPKLPSTPEEVVAFIGDHFGSMHKGGTMDNWQISLTVHDLLSAFQNLAEEAQPADPDDMAANYDHSTHDKRMEVLKGLRAAQPVEDADPVAWLVFAEDNGVMVPQHPAYAVKLQAERCAGLFGQTVVEVRPLYAAPQPAAQPSDDVWQPIETAPRGANGVAFMALAWGVEGDQSTGQGMRINDDFYAVGVFYQLGNKEKPFELREKKITPTHWKPHPFTPD